MPFYKREGEELLVSHTRVEGPGFTLSVETHTEHTYPVNGWYWFDNLDSAMKGISSSIVDGVPQVITIRQAHLALLSEGLLDDVEAMVAVSERAIQIEWNKATELRRDWPALVTLAGALDLTSKQVDDLFRKAAAL